METSDTPLKGIFEIRLNRKKKKNATTEPPIVANSLQEKEFISFGSVTNPLGEGDDI